MFNTDFDESKILDGFRGRELHDMIYSALEHEDEINQKVEERYKDKLKEKKKRRTSLIDNSICIYLNYRYNFQENGGFKSKI